MLSLWAVIKPSDRIIRLPVMAILCATFACCILSGRVQAQAQFTGWAGTFHNYKLSPRTGIYADVQWRSTAQLAQTQALLLRPGFNYFINSRLTATVGYAYIHQQRYTSPVYDYLPEHRIWEQIAYTLPVNVKHARHVTSLTVRARLEQRFIPRYRPEDGQLVRTGHARASRLRYFARSVIPLSGRRPAETAASRAAGAPPQTSFTKGLFCSLQNEVFLNLGDKAAVNGKVFDQNRAYAAMGYRVSKQFDVELGYLNQYISGRGDLSNVNHVLQFATYVRL